jgi:PAS domain S-box-containing protein
MENLVDGVIVLDMNNRIIEINPQARIFLGIENRYVVGRPVADFLQPWPGLVERFREVQAGRAEIHLGGREVSDIDVRISPLFDNQKNQAGRIITVRDISEQKKLERTRENLTRSIVHDLRNPLTSVALSLENLRRQAISLPKAQLEAIDMSRQGVQEMLDLVDSILDIYRLEKGEMPLNRRLASLRAVASEAARAASTLAARRRILVQVDVPEGMPPINIDPNLMRRVFQNLLDHLMRGISDGQIVRIQAGFERGESAVVASVFHLGGEETARDALFEKYNSGSKEFSENNLGLVFCRLVVEAHGGRIWVDEHYKKGTKISLTIPEDSRN